MVGKQLFSGLQKPRPRMESSSEFQITLEHKEYWQTQKKDVTMFSGLSLLDKSWLIL